eukprot:CAMPEP_0179414602 /NCGR_PEP_ID=MMETSP0799-20121207/5761_1 /TAXON_ID=46947 /ORGANISM="Geminigera cryophila, Strain CCMP2564" /LENGTH=253 /DNA_ID=CAMNT_0021187235 /DNA_START=279 /DNA_END=1037 /DNA_ORIENTATION=-
MAKQRRYREKTSELITALEAILSGGKGGGITRPGGGHILDDEDGVYEKKSRNKVLLASIDAIKKANSAAKDGGGGGGTRKQPSVAQLHPVNIALNDVSEVSFKEVLSLPATRFGLAVLRPDGTCVSVNPTLLRLLPSFNANMISSQIISVPHGRWRMGDGGQLCCEVDPDEVIVATANAAPNRAPITLSGDQLRVVMVSKRNSHTRDNANPPAHYTPGAADSKDDFVRRPLAGRGGLLGLGMGLGFGFPGGMG